MVVGWWPGVGAARREAASEKAEILDRFGDYLISAGEVDRGLLVWWAATELRDRPERGTVRVSLSTVLPVPVGEVSS